MKKTPAFFTLLIFIATSAFAVAPEEIVSLETIATQTVSSDELSSPYNITGESLVNIIQGMVDFDTLGSSIVFNRRTGQIFVKQSPSNHTVIEQVINNLREVVYKQVQIEARLITVGANDFKGIGLDSLGADFKVHTNEAIIGTNSDPLGSGTQKNLVKFTDFMDALDTASYGGQFSFGVLGRYFDIQTVIEALESRTEVNTLAAPRLMVFNNQRAHLKIAKKENYISEVEANFDTTDVATGTTSVWFQIEAKVKQAQSGTILDVTPTINSDGTITLDMHPNYVTVDLSKTETLYNKNASGNEFPNPLVLPVYTSQSIDTTLTLPNGGVAVLGGLITEDETKTFSKVPLLGDIPYLGKLFFSHESTRDNKSYLLIFIKATVKDSDSL